MKLTKEEIIEKLRLEKSILADGGYRRPWRPSRYLRDSITCLNVGESEKIHPCSECFLSEYFHPIYSQVNIPCHFIPLNAQGDTIDSLMRNGDTDKTEKALLQWLDETIHRLEDERGEEEKHKPGSTSGSYAF